MKKKEYIDHVFNGSFDIVHTKVPVQDKLMQLSTVKLKDGSVVVSSDISLIFNQQRLGNKLTASELREYIQRYTPNKSVYTAQLDDDTLLSTLKSRHIQSLSEMRAWAEYCNWNKDMFMGVLPDTQYGDVTSIDTGGLKAQELYVEARLTSSTTSCAIS